MPSGMASFAAQSIMMNKMEIKVGGQDAPLLDAVGDVKAA